MFGDFELKQTPGRPLVIAEPEIRRATIKKNTDFMVLACDGCRCNAMHVRSINTLLTLFPSSPFIVVCAVWDVISSKEVVKLCYPLLLQYKDPNVVCEKLVERALHRRSMDNISVMLVLFHELNK